MNNAPKISVIMPVYNGEKYLKEAIESILNQTFRDFEFIIINDGSTDNSGKVIANFHDPRIQIINQANQGLRGALNVGITRSTGQYIARMDQDDISLPQRFAKQVEFLDTHPEYVMVGTTYAHIDEMSEITTAFPALLDDEEIKRELYTKTPFGHGTVMIRGISLRKGNYWYSEGAVHMEDYDLWMRFSSAGKYANLPEILYLWRQSPTNTTSKHAITQQRNAYALQKHSLTKKTLKMLISWPGGKSLHKYHNAITILEGKPIIIRRHDAHCSLYLVLSWIFLRQGYILSALIVFFYATLINPFYIFKAIGRRMIPSV